MEADTSVDEHGRLSTMKSAESLTENAVPDPESEPGHENLSGASQAAVGDNPDPVLQDRMENLKLTELIKCQPGADSEAAQAENKSSDKEIARITDEAEGVCESTSKVSVKSGEVEKKKPKHGSYTKVTCRNLPPTLRPEEFLDIVMDIDAEDFDYFHFTRANEIYGPAVTPSALLNFLQPEVANSFIKRFNGFVIVDEAGIEYRMEVDFAICQSVPKPCPPDPLVGKVKETQFFKDFIELFNDSPDGVVGVKPQFRNAKTMAEYVLKELEAKEENKGKLQSTPLLDSLRQKLQAEQDKRARDRENQVKRRKERERQRALRREERREKQEQERKERREKEKRERERRDKERRESKSKQGNSNEKKTEKVDRSNEKDNRSDVKSEPTVKKELQTVKDDNKKAADERPSSQDTKNDAQGPSSSRNAQRSKDYEYKQSDRNYNDLPRRSRNERRNRNRYEKRQGEAENKDKDRPAQTEKFKDQGENRKSTPAQSSSKSEVPGNASKYDVPTKDDGNKPTPKPTEMPDTKITNNTETSTAEKPKTKIVKKVVKIVKVKSSDGVPTEGKVVERKVVRKTEDIKKPNPEQLRETPSSSHNKPEASSSKDEAAASSSSVDRPRRGRPDMQIYRPGSWRQGSSGGNKPTNKNATKDSSNKTQNDAAPAKTTDPAETAKPKGASDG